MDETGIGAGFDASKELEKRRIHFLVVDDAAVVRKSIYEAADNDEMHKVPMQEAADLISGLARLEGPDRPEVLITDMMFPESAESGSKIEGDKVFREILEFYGINANVNSAKIRAARARLERIKDPDDIDEDDRGLELVWALNDLQGDPEFDPFLPEDSEFIREWDESVNFPKTGESQTVRKPDYRYDFKSTIKNEMVALATPDPAKQRLGVRMAEKAHELGIPVVIWTSHHGFGGLFTPLVARYLKDKGICNGEIAMDENHYAIDRIGQPTSADIFVGSEKSFYAQQYDRGEEGKKQVKVVADAVLRRAYEKAIEKNGQ